MTTNQTITCLSIYCKIQQKYLLELKTLLLRIIAECQKQSDNKVHTAKAKIPIFLIAATNDSPNFVKKTLVKAIAQHGFLLMNTKPKAPQTVFEIECDPNQG